MCMKKNTLKVNIILHQPPILNYHQLPTAKSASHEHDYMHVIQFLMLRLLEKILQQKRMLGLQNTLRAYKYNVYIYRDPP